MRIEIHLPEKPRSSRANRFRALLINDSYEAKTISRRAFVGPNLGGHHPDAVEPDYGQQEEPLVLQPFTFYGRERVYEGLTAGEMEITAYYMGRDGQPEIEETRKITVSPD